MNIETQFDLGDTVYRRGSSSPGTIKTIRADIKQKYSADPDDPDQGPTPDVEVPETSITYKVFFEGNFRSCLETELSSTPPEL